jgi:hypothetical protein
MRTSPEEDSIEYKTVIRSRRPKDTRITLPESYWRKPANHCKAMTATGECGQQPDFSEFGRNSKGQVDMCYYHGKVRLGLATPLRGSMWSSSERHDRTPPLRDRPDRKRGRNA